MSYFKRMKSHILALIAAGGLALGCGGASRDLSIPGGTTGEDSGSSGGGPDSGTGGHDSSVPPPPVDSSVRPPDDSGTRPADSGEPKDTSIPDLGVPEVVSTGDPIYCGNATCAQGHQVCCVTNVNTMTGTADYACAGSPAECTNVGGIPVGCDDRFDCMPAQVCCGTLATLNGPYIDVRCQDACGASTEVRFCDPNAAVDECLSLGTFCTPSTLLPGYYVCG